jgi:hypothetical protein
MNTVPTADMVKPTFPISDAEATRLIVLISAACGNVNEKSGCRKKKMHTCVVDIPRGVEVIHDEQYGSIHF